MGIQMTGIDHSIAGIDIRTIFSFTKKNAACALERLKQVKGIEGCVLLSTCNRMELWINTSEDYEEDLYELLCRIREVDPCQYREYFRFRSEKEAVYHLFRLAGGLESRILGEDQIVTQVGEALAMARENYAADHVLETLFRQAVTAAKKVKTSGLLLSSDQSVVHIAIQTLKREGMEFKGKTCMVIGNGVMGKLTAALLQQEGARVIVTVRQYRSGMVQIPPGCERIDYGKRMELFPKCDYVVSATVSPNFTLTKELMEKAVCRPVVLIDLAVPRDIEPAVRELEQVRLYDIDCFRDEAHSEEQKKGIREAELCLQEQMEEFYSWYECVDLMPDIQRLKKEVAGDLSPRLYKELRDLEISEGQREKLRREIESAAERTMNKMFFGLRDRMEVHAFRGYLECMKDIYEF